MIWPFRKKAPSDIDVFKAFARAIFDEVIAGDDYAGSIPGQSAQNIREFWSDKCKDIESWLAMTHRARKAPSRKMGAVRGVFGSRTLLYQSARR